LVAGFTNTSAKLVLSESTKPPGSVTTTVSVLAVAE
jgi:hypothetical protein